MQKIPVLGSLSSGNTLSALDGEIVYFTSANTKTAKRVIYKIGLDGILRDSITFRMDKQLRSERMVQLGVSGKTFVILTNSSIHFYRRSGNSFKREKSLANRYSFNGMEKLGDSYLLHVCYPFHPMDQQETNIWAKLDLASQELVEVHVPEIDNTKFGCFVNSWVSTYGKTIAHASTSKYKIVFYNDSYKPIDSIVRNDVLFVVDTGIVNRSRLQSKEGIVDFMNTDEEKFSRIRKIFMLDDRHLLVLSKLSKNEQPPNGKARLDLWEKTSVGWELRSQIVGDEMFRKGEIYDKQHVFLGNMYQNMSSICVGKSQLYCVSFPYYPMVNTQSFDVDKDINNYLKGSSGFYYGFESVDIIPY